MDFVIVNSEETNTGKTIPVSHAVCTDVGKKRRENQDSFGFAKTAEAELFIVSDGMGGTVGGAVASNLATHIVARASFEHNGKISEESLRVGIEAANKIVHRLGSENASYQRMGTTVVALGICGGRVYYAHVGDSRIYHLRQGEITQLTKDHTLVQQLLDTNKIDATQAKRHPISHVLLRSVGGGETTEVSVSSLPAQAQAGDKFILCCDGLTNEVHDGEIAAVVSALNPKGAVKSLVSLANHRGGSDNITVQIIEFGGMGPDFRREARLASNQLLSVVSTPLEERFYSLLEPYRRRFQEISSPDMESEVVSIDDNTVEEITQDARVTELFGNKAEADNSESKELSVPATSTSSEEVTNFNSELEKISAEGSRRGLPFDTMIFEGESVEDILEIRRLYLAAKSMGTEKLSQVIADAESKDATASSKSPFAANLSTVVAYLGVFLCGGIAVYLLNPSEPSEELALKQQEAPREEVELSKPEKAEELVQLVAASSGLDSAPELPTTKVVTPEPTVEEPKLEEPKPDANERAAKLAAQAAAAKEAAAKEAEEAALLKAEEEKKKATQEKKARETQAKEASSIRAEIRKVEAALAKSSADHKRKVQDLEKELIANSKKITSSRNQLASLDLSVSKWRDRKASIDKGFIRSVSSELAKESKEIESLRAKEQGLSEEYDTIRNKIKRNPNVISRNELRKMVDSRNAARVDVEKGVNNLIRERLENANSRKRRLESSIQALTKKNTLLESDKEVLDREAQDKAFKLQRKKQSLYSKLKSL